MGMIYKRGKVYWIKYYRNGKPYRESTRSAKETDVKRLLKKREGEISDGKLPGFYFDKVKFEDLASDFLTDYRINNKKSLNRAELSISHLAESFGGMKVTNIDTPAIKKYIEKRRGKEAANATINRELAALKTMLMMGARCTPPKVNRVPFVPMLKEKNTRKGYFEHPQFEAVRDRLPDYLKGYVTFAYKTGWRKEEISDLKWPQIDRQNWIVCLNPGETKNEEARTIHLDEELKGIFQDQWEARKKTQSLIPYVFPNREGKGKITDIRKSWKHACEDAGIGKKLFHDFRRTAVRNMVRAGIPERVAMMVSGHKTRSVFDRYNIVDDTDLKLTAQKQEAYLQTQIGTVTSTVRDLRDKKRGQARCLTS